MGGVLAVFGADRFVMAYNFDNDEVEELLREIGIEFRFPR